MPASAAQEAVKNAVREAADIVEVIGQHVELKRVGQRHVGLCPFHGEKTPSFSVNQREGVFYCFGCGAKGDVFSFVMQYEHVEFPEALKMLADRYHIALPERELSEAEKARMKEREALYAVYEAATRRYEMALWDEALGGPGRAYLQHRGVPDEAARRYRLGYAPEPERAGWDWLAKALLEGAGGEHFSKEVLLQSGLAAVGKRGGLYDRFRGRALFPLIDMSGRVTAFGGRILGEGKPKYLNSPESPIFSKSRQLFGLHPHREAIRKARRAFVVEGNFDLLSLSIHGVENVVAPLGTALTKEHVHALKHYCDEVVLLFDADAAGFKAAMRSVPFFLEESLNARVALLPQGHDPDTYVREQGKSAVEALAEKAQPLAEFSLNALIAQHGLSLAGKARIANELRLLIRAATGREQRELMIAHFAGKLGVSASYFSGRSLEPTSPSPPPRAMVDRPTVPASSPLRQLSQRERQLLDFLLFWPEYRMPLVEAGLADAVQNPGLRHLLELMQDLDTGAGPEELLTTPLTPGERAYLMERLSRPPLELGEEPAAAAQGMYEQLVDWLGRERQHRRAAQLQLELAEAERQGDLERARELLRAKVEKKGAKI